MKKDSYKGQMYQRAEITVFLSLILLLILSFLLSLVQSAWIQMAKGEVRSVSEMSMESVFGEYQTELLNYYDLFLIDGGYRTGSYAEDTVLRHYRHYAEACTEQGGSDVFGHTVNWKLHMQDAKISAIQMATDQGGEAILYEISDYMQMHTGVELLQGLTGQGESLQKQAENLKQKQEQYTRENRKNIEDMVAAQEAGGEQTEEEEDSNASSASSQVENPLDHIHAVQKVSILDLVMPEGRTVSDKKADTKNLASHRNLRTGYGHAAWAKERSQTLDQILFYTYLHEKLLSFTDKGSANRSVTGTEHTLTHGLDYELEYLIYGAGSDRENLEKTVGKLLLLREGINFAYLLTDSAKVGEAEALAAVLAGSAGMPPLVEPIKWALLLAWAYGESVLDVKALLGGGKLSPVKTAANWKLALSNLGDIGSTAVTHGDDSGQTYEEWLMLLLATGQRSRHVLRFCDLLELNLNREPDVKGFRMDDCIYGMTIENVWETDRGITYTFPISYGYH